MRKSRERRLDAETLTKDEGRPGRGEAKLLRELNESLHEVSQPMTVLLCTLEYGAGLDSVEEMRQTMFISQEACERLRKTVISMQTHVREAIKESHARRDRLVEDVT